MQQGGILNLITKELDCSSCILPVVLVRSTWSSPGVLQQECVFIKKNDDLHDAKNATGTGLQKGIVYIKNKSVE